MVFNEAKLLGLPIISTNFGSASEFITDEKQVQPLEGIAEAIYVYYKNQHIQPLEPDRFVEEMDSLARLQLENLFN